MGGLKQYMPRHVLADDARDARDRRHSAVLGLFSKDEILAAAFARGAENPVYYAVLWHGLLAAFLTAFLHGAPDGDDLPGPEPYRRQGERAPARGAGNHDRSAQPVLGVLSVAGGVLNLPGAGRRRRGAGTLAAPGDRAQPRSSTRWRCRTARPRVLSGRLRGGDRRHRPARGIRRDAPRTHRAREKAPADTGFARVLLRKYYIDEIYDAVIVRPLVWLSRVILWKGVDQHLVDGAAVNGSARLSRIFGWAGSKLQTGQVGMHAILFS